MNRTGFCLSALIAVLTSEAFAACCDYVDPFIGTAGTGHTHPAAACPFGMVQAGPDTGYGSWAYCSGYQHGDASVYGYSQNHLSGTGCPDLGDVQILPFVGELGPLPARRAIDKRTEKASPGFYSVVQPEDGLTVEITASRHAAMYRIVSRSEKEIKVLVNLPSIIHAEWGRFYTSAADVKPGKDKHSIAGKLVRQGWITNRPICFSLAFDKAWTNIERLPDMPDDVAPRYVVTFPSGSELMVKVGLSMTSADAARRNLIAEMPAWDFKDVRRKAEAEWNRLLSRTRAEGDADFLRNWYTALYHLYLQPMDYADVGEEPYLTTLSLWDTYRAAHPWYTLATPEIVTPCVRSMLKVAREEGKLPVMSYGGKYIECMIGNHAIPVIADAYLKGFRGFDAREALMWMTNSVTVVHGKGKMKEDWDVLDRYGYYPFDLIPSESVSRTLECAYDDWCVARFAEAVGEPAVAARFDARARGWRQVVDAASGFARGKDSNGVWRTPFNPFALGGGEERLNDFTEGNSFQWTWSVPQDVEGLMAALGGRERFAKKLDALFEAPISADGMGERVDVTGLIGQYAHGNEPSHHVAYLYSLVGCPDKAAERIREICRRFYRSTPDGICGNEDCGQMSAWFVFSAMGFYPLNPCGGEYVIGAPQVPKVTLRVCSPSSKSESENGIANILSTTTTSDYNSFTIIAKNLSKENKYVRSVTLNGRPLEGFTIRHADILRGGELVFEMTSDPR